MKNNFVKDFVKSQCEIEYMISGFKIVSSIQDLSIFTVDMAKLTWLNLKSTWRHNFSRFAEIFSSEHDFSETTEIIKFMLSTLVSAQKNCVSNTCLPLNFENSANTTRTLNLSWNANFDDLPLVHCSPTFTLPQHHTTLSTPLSLLTPIIASGLLGHCPSGLETRKLKKFPSRVSISR